MPPKRVLLYLLFVLSLFITPTTLEPIGWITKKTEITSMIQHFVIINEVFAMTTKFPVYVLNQTDICGHTYSESEKYCIEVKTIKYPQRNLDFAMIEFHKQFYFTTKTTCAPLRLDGNTLAYQNYQYVTKFPDLPVEAEFARGYTKPFQTAYYFHRIEKWRFLEQKRTDYYVNFTRYMSSDEKPFLLCTSANGLPLYGEYGVVGLFSFTSLRCIADMMHCVHECDYLDLANSKSYVLHFLNLIHTDIVNYIKTAVPGYA